jgi:hypothetical protein
MHDLFDLLFKRIKTHFCYCQKRNSTWLPLFLLKQYHENYNFGKIRYDPDFINFKPPGFYNKFINIKKIIKYKKI